MKRVECVETGKSYYFDAQTGYQALEKMRYTLDLKAKDNKAVINKTPSGIHLWMEHSGRTYAVAI